MQKHFSIVFLLSTLSPAIAEDSISLPEKSDQIDSISQQNIMCATNVFSVINGAAYENGELKPHATFKDVQKIVETMSEALSSEEAHWCIKCMEMGKKIKEKSYSINAEFNESQKLLSEKKQAQRIVNFRQQCSEPMMMAVENINAQRGLELAQVLNAVSTNEAMDILDIVRSFTTILEKRMEPSKEQKIQESVVRVESTLITSDESKSSLPADTASE